MMYVFLRPPAQLPPQEAGNSRRGRGSAQDSVVTRIRILCVSASCWSQRFRSLDWPVLDDILASFTRLESIEVVIAEQVDRETWSRERYGDRLPIMSRTGKLSVSGQRAL